MARYFLFAHNYDDPKGGMHDCQALSDQPEDIISTGERMDSTMDIVYVYDVENLKKYSVEEFRSLHLKTTRKDDPFPIGYLFQSGSLLYEVVEHIDTTMGDYTVRIGRDPTSRVLMPMKRTQLYRLSQTS